MWLISSGTWKQVLSLGLCNIAFIKHFEYAQNKLCMFTGYKVLALSKQALVLRMEAFDHANKKSGSDLTVQSVMIVNLYVAYRRQWSSQ